MTPVFLIGSSSNTGDKDISTLVHLLWSYLPFSIFVLSILPLYIEEKKLSGHAGSKVSDRCPLGDLSQVTIARCQ